MAYPDPYSRQYDYQSYQNANPTRPLPADKVNADLNAVAESTDQIVAFLQGFTRDDGALANASVGPDQLTDDVSALIGDTTAVAAVYAARDAAAASQTAAAASQTAAATSETNSATSASGAATSASSASTSASSASTSATSAAASATSAAASATVVAGNEYAFATSTTMADPSTGNVRFNNATVASVTAIAISALTNESGNPNIRSFVAAWDDSTNTTRGYVLLRKIGTPATFAIFSISGALTDNTTWLQLAVTYTTGNGTWSASDRMSVQFFRAGDKGADGAVAISGTPSAGQFGVWTGASTQKGVGITGLVKGNGASDPTAAVSGTDYAPATSGSALLKANGSGGFGTPGTGDSLTIGSIELGNASDTTLTRASAGVIAVEGVNLTPNMPIQSQSVNYTTVLADANTAVLHPSSDNNARTFSIPANGTVAYPVGTTLTFINKINTVTISINTDTLTLLGTGATGNRTLAANGMATAIKITSTEWVISGPGLT